MNNKEFIKYITKEENLINDFEDYLKENNKEITMNWKINDENIQNFLKTIINKKNIEYSERFFEILDNYCCQMPF